jgi:hypothetical protein
LLRIRYGKLNLDILISSLDAPLTQLRTATLYGLYTVSNLWQIDSATVNDSGYNCG